LAFYMNSHKYQILYILFYSLFYGLLLYFYIIMFL